MQVRSLNEKNVKATAGWGLLLVVCIGGQIRADSWPMRQRDVHNTGRTDFVVPASRMNHTFFDVLAWQKQSPGSPNDGNFSSTSMVFFDEVGPGGTDVVVGGFHWPKGVQGMNRHTGALSWNGNPGGGEAIGTNTPAFSNDGSVVYVTNDYNVTPEFPNGFPLMAFHAAVGPSVFWHNGTDVNPSHLGAFSPKIAPDGRIFLHAWVDRPYAAEDLGASIVETWAAQTPADCGLSDPTLHVGGGQLQVVVGARYGAIIGYDGDTGSELWRQPVAGAVDAPATIDPISGNIYVGAGDSSIYVVGLDRTGNQLWSSVSPLVYNYSEGVNHPERTQAAGCLTHDGETYYFQTNSQQGEGHLYAINTADGSVRWTLATGSLGWEQNSSSSPIVTPNGVIVVGNNDAGTYYAIRDDGSSATVLDTFAVDPAGNARASATLAPDGKLYLPLRTTWFVTNGDGDAPTFQGENVFSCFDLAEGASSPLPPPSGQTAIALNHAVRVSWTAIIDRSGQFDHYAVYRATGPFTSVSGWTPVGTVGDIGATSFLDATAANGTSYFYAVATVAQGGGQSETVHSIGPRTPLDETDLQVVSVSRTPRYPRYAPIYTNYEITEPSGFGSYYFSAATGLGNGQDASTQRWPNLNDPVTYTATVRNRGTNPWTTPIGVSWRVDGIIVARATQSVVLQPGDVTTFTFIRNWEQQAHDIGFTLEVSDARAENNSLTINTKSVAFLSYVDRSRLEDFREETRQYPDAATDDFLDWLNRSMVRFNQMFVDAGTAKRVHFDVLEVLEDRDADPNIDTIPFAVFPFRYRASEGSLRLSGYYSPSDDIDFGLLHEMGHQLGLIDIYQLNLGPDQNQVAGTGYNAVPCLMNGVSHFLSQNSALAMTHWLDIAHGYFGQYLYGIPTHLRMRFTGFDGQPLVSATVRVFQKLDRPDLGQVITRQVKFEGLTDSGGYFDLPNVNIDGSLVPRTFAGDELHDNPFGYVAVVGNNGLLLFEVEDRGAVDYAWLDITEANNAYRLGQTDEAVFERRLALGGPLQFCPPPDMAEQNAASWASWSEDGTISVSNDPGLKYVGQSSLRIDTTGGFDNYVRYPGDRRARWDLSDVQRVRVWFNALNPNDYGFQSQSPWLRLGNRNGFFEWRPTFDILDNAIDQWVELTIPIGGDDVWQRTILGSPVLSEISYIELHADTWGYGFSLWMDGLEFDPGCAVDLGDFREFRACMSGPGMAPDPLAPFTPEGCREAFDTDGDGDVDMKDFAALQASFTGP